MSLSPRRRHECSARMLLVALVVAVVIPVSSANAVADEIPHENYEYVSTDLGVLVSLLNTSILYFEASFTALHDEDTSGGSQNLSAVNSLLGPAENVLDDLAEIAESYEDLSRTIPLFAALADEEWIFISLEAELIDAREALRSLSGKTSLTDNETILAMTAFNEASAIMSKMNSSIDSMLLLAAEMTSLSIEEEYPFSESNLEALIESLRDLLYKIEVELVELIEGEGGEGGTPGIAIEPFLTLWISDTSLHLGDDLVGGGYLYFNGSLQPGRTVDILRNGAALLSSTTSSLGAFGFRFSIPIDSSWLGLHEISAFFSGPYGNLTSAPITISVSLIPTSLSISVSTQLLSPVESLAVTVMLRDIRGDVVPDAGVSFALDGVFENVTVDSQGRYATSFAGTDLGIGTHSLSASYEGGMPYAPCDSPKVTVKVDVPTTLELSLYSDRIYLGYYIVGEGSLTAETSGNLSGMRIVLLIDGRLMHNVTTDEDGGFAFSIPSQSLSVGDHILTAEFLPDNMSWRRSEAEAAFHVYATEHTAKYPFWPLIPGWGGLGAPPEIAFNLFFGEYAYFGWLLVVSIIAVVVKTLRMRRATLAKKARLAEMSSEREMAGVFSAESSEELKEVYDLDDLIGPPDTPNEKIVWSYNDLLRFLVSNRKIQILASMTHREIARMLEAFGYPPNLVNRVTNLFEMARYSDTPMTESEMSAMDNSVEQIKTTVLKGGRRHAA